MRYTASTRVYPVDPAEPDPVALRIAADTLRRGGLVAFPTETVYGLGANALDREAVDRIFSAKNRPANDPLIVHVADEAQLLLVAGGIPAQARLLIDSFWPGPLTLVLPRGRRIPPNVSSGLPTVAVRMPSGSIACALLRTAGLPIAAPSANTFSRPSATTAAHVLEDLNGHVDAILDGGPAAIGVESTVVDLTDDQPRVLRPGGIPLERLRGLLPDITVRERYLEGAEAGASPGMLLKHYSPNALMMLFDGERSQVLAVMRERASALIDQGQKVGVLLLDGERDGFPDGVLVETLGIEAQVEQVAARLFNALRGLDAAGADVILAHLIAHEGLGAAVRDRLLRAAEGRVETV